MEATKPVVAKSLATAAEERAANGAESSPADRIQAAANRVIALRKRPLLILFYPGFRGVMMAPDVEATYQVLRTGGIQPDFPVASGDVLLHTYGGDPTAAYQMAEVIRRLMVEATFLVPHYAYSAGTLLCFAGQEIRLGHAAGLSPIDITLHRESEDQAIQEDTELASIDYFMEFAADSQRAIQRSLRGFPKASTSVGSDLLCKLVDQVGALKVGEFYRARRITEHYAQELLDTYMLSGVPNALGIRNRIIRELLFKAPQHEQHFGFRLCRKMGLNVEELSTQEFDACRDLVVLLDGLVAEGSICPDMNDQVKMPFFAYYSNEGGSNGDAEPHRDGLDGRDRDNDVRNPSDGVGTE